MRAVETGSLAVVATIAAAWGAAANAQAGGTLRPGNTSWTTLRVGRSAPASSGDFGFELSCSPGGDALRIRNGATIGVDMGLVVSASPRNCDLARST